MKHPSYLQNSVTLGLTLAQRREKPALIHAYGTIIPLGQKPEQWVDEALFVNFTRAQYHHLQAAVISMLDAALEAFDPDAEAWRIVAENAHRQEGAGAT